MLTNHYQPAPIVIAERHKFWTASQGETEKVNDFVVRLKKLASTCRFGAFLEDALRDRLVFGLHSKFSRTQRHLLCHRNLTFIIARDYCIVDEWAGKANQEHMGEASNAEANRVQQQPGKKDMSNKRFSKPQDNSPEDKSTVDSTCFSMWCQTLTEYMQVPRRNLSRMWTEGPYSTSMQAI